jgi:hypothetical protein
MGAKRSSAAMRQLRDRFLADAAARGVEHAVAVEVFEEVSHFAGYGFPVLSPNNTCRSRSRQQLNRNCHTHHSGLWLHLDYREETAHAPVLTMVGFGPAA